ncbi:pyruvate formate lyase family protein, partial [Klebsiella quasipneumoniae]
MVQAGVNIRRQNFQPHPPALVHQANDLLGVMLDSAAILHHVPAHPARNFKEACQAFYLFQLA